MVITYYFFFKLIEKREVTELDIRHLPKSLVFGFLLGFGLISMVVFTLYILGNYTIVSINSLRVLSSPLLLFVVMGIWEEIIFRGIIFRIVENALGTIYALVISSVIFSVVHFSNTGFNLVSSIAIVLELGILTGIVFSITRNIWYPIFLHIGWNFAFVFYGITVSGADELNTFIEGNLTGPAVITGGDFGPENSLITILLSVIVFAILYLRKKLFDDQGIFEKIYEKNLS